MDLLLGQLVYTNFAGMGFRTLASAQVPKEIQQAFIQRVVSRHWDSHNPPRSGYRAIYLHQVTSEHSLFGWLYNDGADDMGRSCVPYFICYYLVEPVSAFQLENIFTFLHNGPVAVIDRHSLPASLETKVVPDLWSYQEARPGVAIPSVVRKRSHIALQQKELLDLFVPVAEQDIVIELNDQTYEQHKAKASIYIRYSVRYIVEGFKTGAAALNEDAAAIGTEVIKRDSEKKTDRNSVLPYRNSQLRLKAGIAATVLALIGGLIYGLLQTSIFAPSKFEFMFSASRFVFYKTLAQVSNVPQGLFNYGGSTAFAPLRSQSILGTIAQAHPQFHLRYIEPINHKPGSGTGIDMLLKGELSFAQSSRPLNDAEYSKARARGFTLEQVPVALDGIVFYTHPDVPIAELSVDQLQAIFTGKVTNWKQVGGPDLPVVPFSKHPEVSSTINILLDGLKGEGLGRNVQIVRDITASIRKVASTSGGISYATASEVRGQRNIRPLSLAKAYSRQYVRPFTDSGQVNAEAFRDGTYPLTRLLFVVIRRDGQLAEQVGVAYANLLLSTEGQQLIERVGFVAIRR